MSDDSLQAAITAMRNALGQVCALVAEHPGDHLYYDTETTLTALINPLVARQCGISKRPPTAPADAAFYG